MFYQIVIGCVIASGIGGALSSCALYAQLVSNHIRFGADIPALFPTTVQELKDRVDRAIVDAREQIKQAIAVADSERTFANTVGVVDKVCSISDLAVMGYVTEVTDLVAPNPALRSAAHDHSVAINKLYPELVLHNIELYRAVKAYADGNGKQETLSQEQAYYLKDLVRSFERNGAQLPPEQRAQAAQLDQETIKLCADFSKNIADTTQHIIVDAQGLQGLDQDFINALKRTDDGRYILGVDYPTTNNVFANCTVEDTRKQLMCAVYNRAYPENEPLLKQIIAKRDERAKLLGFKTFAHLQLDGSMVESPERAQAFLDDLFKKSSKKVDQESALWKSNLPDGVTLTEDGRIKLWDLGYIINCYKKKHLNINERLIAEYFPTESTIAGLLDIYRQFLGIDFKEVPIQGLWHPDVKLIQVASQDSQAILGYILLDLYPRPNKYSHACHSRIIVGLSSNENPALSILVCNFPKPTAIKPSLLSREFVVTFFHEFGHALHAMLGRTELGSHAGTRVKRDFVELPSQMLEEWLGDKDILKNLSRHYVTGAQLPDELLDAMTQSRRFTSGTYLRTQLLQAQFALSCFMKGAGVDPDTLYRQLYATMRPEVVLDPATHWFAAFGHLTGYGAQYYGYLWSRVYALDLFAEIKKHGLLNPEIGHKYVREILSKGGSQDPNQLLANFLGREPNADAFFNDMGIE